MSLDDLTLTESLQELSSAEDFLQFFSIGYDPTIVQVNRLHILQRFHNYLAEAQAEQMAEGSEKFAVYQQCLQQAYTDFVHSDAMTEKVFKVFRQNEPQTTVIPLAEAFKQR